tara:strand:+ start:4878 stop:5123 length:246 start_codon:yes stop_codon:yes gene_type:complete
MKETLLDILAALIKWGGITLLCYVAVCIGAAIIPQLIIIGFFSFIFDVVRMLILVILSIVVIACIGGGCQEAWKWANNRLS